MVHKNLNEIIDQIITSFVSSPSISLTVDDIQPGTVIRSLIEAVSIAIYQLYQNGDLLEINSSPSTASGVYLDLIGQIVGCPRQPGETDDDYRSDIENSQLDARTCGQRAIDNAVQDIQGVANYTIKNLSHGAGSFTVYVQPTYGSDPSSVVSSVTSAISSVVAEGVYFDVITPQPMEISMDISIICDSYTDQMGSAIKNIISKYITSIQSGQTLYFDSITTEVVKTYPSVRSIYIHSMTENGKTIYGQSITLLEDEQFYVDNINIIS